MTDRVRTTLLDAIRGHFYLSDIATTLELSTRTLQRQLKDEGTTFRALLQDTRKKLALQYLQRTRLNSTELAFLLGFGQPTSFFRAFRRWTGASPEKIRRLKTHKTDSS